jgi:hypothetical protein
MVYVATRVALPNVPCTVPTPVFQHRWNAAASNVRSDVSIAKYLAIAGGIVAVVVAVALGRPRAWIFVFLVPYSVVMILVIMYGNSITNQGCGI